MPLATNAPKGFRSFGNSKDHRPDRPQVVLGMAGTREGIPVRWWVWPGNTQDQTVVAQVKRDLAGWQPNRVVWVVDSGCNSADNRREGARRLKLQRRRAAARLRARRGRRSQPPAPLPPG